MSEPGNTVMWLQARASEAAEEAAEKARLAELEAKRVAAQALAMQMRQLREALSWLRSSARWPKDSLPRQVPLHQLHIRRHPFPESQHACSLLMINRNASAGKGVSKEYKDAGHRLRLVGTPFSRR